MDGDGIYDGGKRENERGKTMYTTEQILTSHETHKTRMAKQRWGEKLCERESRGIMRNATNNGKHGKQ